LGAQTRKTTGNIVAKSHCDMPLECEGIYLSIGAYVETVLGCNQRLEMMKPGHCRSWGGQRLSHQYLPGTAGSCQRRKVWPNLDGQVKLL
jgi:hypothetical protein